MTALAVSGAYRTPPNSQTMPSFDQTARLQSNPHSHYHSQAAFFEVFFTDFLAAFLAGAFLPATFLATFFAGLFFAVFFARAFFAAFLADAFLTAFFAAILLAGAFWVLFLTRAFFCGDFVTTPATVVTAAPTAVLTEPATSSAIAIPYPTTSAAFSTIVFSAIFRSLGLYVHSQLRIVHVVLLSVVSLVVAAGAHRFTANSFHPTSLRCSRLPANSCYGRGPACVTARLECSSARGRKVGGLECERTTYFGRARNSDFLHTHWPREERAAAAPDNGGKGTRHSNRIKSAIQLCLAVRRRIPTPSADTRETEH